MRDLISALILFFITAACFADEGMWMPNDIKQLPISEAGCQMSAQELYNPEDSSSLSRAIIGLGSVDNPFRFFCSAEIISSKGLLLTNYHCGTRMIQAHSSVGENIFKNGFWAHSLSEELKNEGLTASVLLNMTDISDSVFSYLSDSMPLHRREQIIDSVADAIEERISVPEGEALNVKSFYEGNRYFLMHYRTYNDVRLVGVPPRSIGKFGGETDNWEWPRHTGDFCVLRIYTDSLGQPADFDSTNIPLVPDRFLQLSSAGYEDGDFSFVMGFPGSTERYLSSPAVELLTNVLYSERVKIREAKLAVLDSFMLADEEIAIKYYVRHQGIANYYKNFKGQIEAVRKHDVIAEKKVQEAKIIEWLKIDSFSDPLVDLDRHYQQIRAFKFADAYYKEGLFYASASFYTAYKFETLYKKLKHSPDSLSDIKAEQGKLQRVVEKEYDNFLPEVDEALFCAGLEQAYDNLSKDFRPDYFITIDKKYNRNVESFCEKAYEKSVFSSKKSLDDFLENPTYKTLEKDPIFQLMLSSILKLRALRKTVKISRDSIEVKKQLFVKNYIEYQELTGTLSYPDANSTLRFTYGKIAGYHPRDAVYYKHYTTAKGILEKYKPSGHEFFVEEETIDLLKENEYLPICFISDNDITGGNSGSPVMNGKGQLIGIAFDGNWEAMSGDLLFEDKLQRCINADIRYVLFIIKNIGDCYHILNELEISN